MFELFSLLAKSVTIPSQCGDRVHGVAPADCAVAVPHWTPNAVATTIVVDSTIYAILHNEPASAVHHLQ